MILTKDYTIQDGEFYKVLHMTTGLLITYGRLIPDQYLSTNHTVVWITEEEYNILVELEENN